MVDNQEETQCTKEVAGAAIVSDETVSDRKAGDDDFNDHEKVDDQADDNEVRNSELVTDQVKYSSDDVKELARDHEKRNSRVLNSHQDDHDVTNSMIVNDKVDGHGTKTPGAGDNQSGNKVPDKLSQQSSDSSSLQSATDVITHQPKSSTKTPTSRKHVKPLSDNEVDIDLQDKSTLEVELGFEPGACLYASAGVGSASKDFCDGFTNLECRYPNVGCELSCGCDDGLQLVSDCTMELCSANCILGCLACTLGLALDTKMTWNQDGVEFEVLGTGFETSQGKVLRLFGSGLGIIDDEKRETMEKKRKLKEAKKAQKKTAEEKKKLEKKGSELETSGRGNTAAEVELEHQSNGV